MSLLSILFLLLFSVTPLLSTKSHIISNFTTFPLKLKRKRRGKPGTVNLTSFLGY